MVAERERAAEDRDRRAHERDVAAAKRDLHAGVRDGLADDESTAAQDGRAAARADREAAASDRREAAAWSPIPFSLDTSDSARLRPGTTTRVSGRLLGAHVRFHLHTVAADAGRLHLHARGPIDILVDYTLKPIRAGCALDALICIDPPSSRLGRLLARATGLLLSTGTLDHAMTRIAHEAELKANPSAPPAGATEPRRRAHAQTRPRT